MPTDKLKPCPFCGSSNLEYHYEDIEGWIAHVRCIECDDMIGPMSKYKYDNQHEAAEDAASIWNRRALTAAEQAEPAPSGAVKVLKRLLSIAEKQKAYFGEKQREFPSIEECVNEDGEFTPSANIYALLQGEGANGRYSEADWWVSTIRNALSALEPADPAVDEYGGYWEDGGKVYHHPPEPATDAHPDDLAVDRFAAAMKDKLAQKRSEGRGGWDNSDECSIEYLSYLLVQHVWKGDPIDIGNLAMMIQQRGARIVIDDETRGIVPATDAEPVAWRYRYNGQFYLSPSKSFAAKGFDPEPLYTLPQPDSRLREALKRIVEGNLGDDPWQANYDKIRQVARDALAQEAGR